VMVVPSYKSTTKINLIMVGHQEILLHLFSVNLSKKLRTIMYNKK